MEVTSRMYLRSLSLSVRERQGSSSSFETVLVRASPLSIVLYFTTSPSSGIIIIVIISAVALMGFI